MPKLYYIVHSTSTDNENGVVSGQFDCSLSTTGIKQAKTLADIIRNSHTDFGSIYCSPLKRAKQTAEILFPEQSIMADIRLMEIDYGDYTHHAKTEIDEIRGQYINTPFPNGESYEDVENRMRSFLRDRTDSAITVVAHQAPQLALDVITKLYDFRKAFRHDWRLSKNGWQPFWIYDLDKD